MILGHSQTPVRPLLPRQSQGVVFDFKTTWSEFQKPYQTAATQGKAELGIYNLSKTSPPQSRSQAVVCAQRVLPSIQNLAQKPF